jgi:hypothetical protein
MCNRSFRCIVPQRILTAIGALALIAFLFGISPQPALAQGGVDDPAGPFQLESNATTDTGVCFTLSAGAALLATPGSGNSCPGGYTFVAFGASSDDWQNALGFGGGASEALATSFVGPTTNPAEKFNSGSDDTFFGGGSKDTSGISSGPWEWKGTSVNAKDDIEHAYAAAYSLPNGHTAIYFGMDRWDNSGDATAGFWFFQDGSVALSNTKSGGGLLFAGHHSDKDLLIVSDFSQGGAVGSIQAFEWSCPGKTGAACDSGGSLVAASSLLTTNITCDPRTGKSGFCAVVNDTDGLTAPWGFTNKSNETKFAHGEFLEGGIDLNTLFGSNIPCFSTFMAETRSSNSGTASLEDLTPPVSFPLCGMSVSKSCNGGTVGADGTSVNYSYSASVHNDGVGSIYNITLHDTLPDGTTSDIAVSLPDSCNGTACLGPKHTATVTPILFTATSANCHAGVTNCTTPLDAINTVSAKGFSAPNSGGIEIDTTKDATAECKVSPSSSISVTKHCDADAGGATLFDAGSVVEVKVFYVAHVCNGGTSQLTSISLQDDWGNPVQHDSPSSIASLAPGACTDVKSSYVPNSIDSSSGRYGFTDTIRVTSATATLGSNPSPAASCPASTDLACAAVTCPICFDNVCTLQPQP